MILLFACQAPMVVASPKPGALAAVDSGPSLTPIRLKTRERRFDGAARDLTGKALPAAWFRLDFGDSAQLTHRNFGPATTIPIVDGAYLVHLFAYSMLGGDGSMGGAAGKDVWLFQDGEETIRLFEEEEATMWRIRNPHAEDGVWGASEIWLLSDVDGDGDVDIGRRTETAVHVDGAFELHQTPVKWHLAKEVWATGHEMQATWAIEVPRPVIGPTATDFIVDHNTKPTRAVGDEFWNPPPRQEVPTVYPGWIARTRQRR